MARRACQCPDRITPQHLSVKRKKRHKVDLCRRVYMAFGSVSADAALTSFVEFRFHLAHNECKKAFQGLAVDVPFGSRVRAGFASLGIGVASSANFERGFYRYRYSHITCFIHTEIKWRFDPL